MMKSLLCLLVCLTLLASVSFAQKTTPPVPQLTTRPASASGLPSEETVNAFMKQMFGYDPQVSWNVSEIRPASAQGLAEVSVVITDSQGSRMNKFYVTADGKHAVTGEIIPFGSNPFEEDRAKLDKGVNGPSKGPKDAPVIVVEFSDMQCPHCKEAAPNVEKLIEEEPNTRFIFQNFPLPAHNWAERAAEYVDCVGRTSNDAVWKFIQKTFDRQNNITQSNADEQLKTIASDSGVNPDEIAACADKPETRNRVQASLALGKAVGVTGTPALFINGRMVSAGAPVDALKKIVEFQAGSGKEQAKQ